MAKQQIPNLPNYEADLVMRGIMYDSILLQPDIEKYNLFADIDDSRETSFRYNNEHEKGVIQWLLTNEFDNNMRLTREELNIDHSYVFYPEVTSPIISDNGIPGDIDLLAISASHPQKSIGIQVKRVKACILENGNANIYVKQIPKGVAQATEMMKKYCFHRNYLMLLLVADTQYHHNHSQMFRNLSYNQKRCVYSHPALSTLPEDVGLYVYEVSQPSKNDIQQTATIAVKEHRSAKRLEQSSKTTEAIIQFLKMKK